MQTIRTRIDEIDDKILTLFCERMELVFQIAERKQELGRDVFDPVRESEKLRTAVAVGGDAYGSYTRQLMQQMMAISRDYQAQQRLSDSPKPTQK